MVEHWTFQREMMMPPGEPISGETFRADGWAYIDPPAWFTDETWAEFLAIFGEGNYRILAMSRGRHPSDNLPFVRGQIIVSPEGWANLESRVASDRLKQ